MVADAPETHATHAYRQLWIALLSSCQEKSLLPIGEPSSQVPDWDNIVEPHCKGSGSSLGWIQARQNTKKKLPSQSDGIDSEIAEKIAIASFRISKIQKVWGVSGNSGTLAQ